MYTISTLKSHFGRLDNHFWPLKDKIWLFFLFFTLFFTLFRQMRRKEQYFDDKKSKCRQIYTISTLKSHFGRLDINFWPFKDKIWRFLTLIRQNRWKNNISTIKNHDLDTFLLIFTLKPNFGQWNTNFWPWIAKIWRFFTFFLQMRSKKQYFDTFLH